MTPRRLGRMRGLPVDAAVVVGRRPDGWGRDRAGGAGRLLDRLAALPGRTLALPDGAEVGVTGVVAVVEGRARDVPAPGEGAGVRVVRADGSGDDALAATAAELVASGQALLVV